MQLKLSPRHKRYASNPIVRWVIVYWHSKIAGNFNFTQRTFFFFKVSNFKPERGGFFPLQITHVRQMKVVLYRKPCYNIFSAWKLLLLRERDFHRYDISTMHCKLIAIQINNCISGMALIHRFWIAFFFSNLNLSSAQHDALVTWQSLWRS